MRISPFLILFFSAVSLRAQSDVVDIPAVAPATMGGRMSSRPNSMRDTDYFGRVKSPRLEASDPYDSAQMIQGRDPSSETLPGSSGKILEDVSKKIVIQYGSNPTVSITYGQAVSILLMRQGKVIMPSRATAGITPAPSELVTTNTQENSPYIYVTAKSGQVFPAGNYPYTEMYVSVSVDGHPVQYQIRLKAVGPQDPSLRPLVMLDLVGELPEAYADASTVSGAVGGSVQEHPTASSGVDAAYVLGSNSPASVKPPLTRTQIRKFMPTMIEMAKLYPSAVYDHAPGYTPNDIVAFSPASVKDGEIVRGRVPSFRNPLDGQAYHLVAGFYFPQYDALLYEVAFMNTGTHDLWWNFSLTKLLFGLGGIDDAVPVTAASPEFFEVTPVGKKNILWILLQGHGILPSSAVRLVFPSGVTEPELTAPGPQETRASLEMVEPTLETTR